MKVNSGDIQGVSIVPPVIEFFDVEPSCLYQINVCVKNTSRNSKAVRYYAPKTKSIKLKAPSEEVIIASGLNVPAVIEYVSGDSCHQITDRVVVTVDGEAVEVPLFIYPAQPLLEVEKCVDFGNVLANSKVLSHDLHITNHGSHSGEFSLKCPDKSISFVPSLGLIPSHSLQVVKVELVANKAASVLTEASVALEGQDAQTVTIKANIFNRQLDLLNADTGDYLEHIAFDSVYYGTDKTLSAVLFNNSPEPLSFVAILQENIAGQEAGKESVVASENDIPLTSLLTAIPNQGSLAAYEQMTIVFQFSPRWRSPRRGWKSENKTEVRQDYALFLHIQILGAQANISGGTFIEVAVTGTALPVQLNLAPADVIDFGQCKVGEHGDILCKLTNDSPSLPALFQFRRLAHFTIHPPYGKIAPRRSQDLIFSFAPNQIGNFSPVQKLDVIGEIVNPDSPNMMSLRVIHTLNIKLSGSSDPITKKRPVKFNPGITPKIANEVGMFIDTTFATLENDKPRNAVHSINKSGLHGIKAKKFEETALVAFPNDRAGSIRPSDRKLAYRTLFTGAPRHTFVDPDYAFTDSELGRVTYHRNQYLDLVGQLRENRIQAAKSRKFDRANNERDIGLVSHAGLRPERLSLEDIHKITATDLPSMSSKKHSLLSSKQLANDDVIVRSMHICEGLNAIPMTAQEKSDYTQALTPQELHRVCIGPAVVDFGKVCLRSVSTKNISIVNNLDQHVHIIAEVDCRELRQTSPLSQVVPPKAHAILPLIFESSTKGKFQRCVSYTVNGGHQDHITVLAEVVPMALELSSNMLVLLPNQGLPAEAGFRSVITLYNRLNHSAEFTWAPNLGDKGTAFSIRPATGVVEAFRDLDCEVVWHPSYLAPESGSFSLLIMGGTTLQLECQAQLGSTSVQFTEQRLLFGQVPIHLTTSRTAVIANTGQNHAYFQVVDPNPLPGMLISPLQGVIPVGGTSQIILSLTPESVTKFDSNMRVAIKGWKTIELRMGGTILGPSVDIDVPSFNFGGVYCGSGSSLPFKLTNKSLTKTKMEFDLTRYADFTLNFPGYQSEDDFKFELLNPGVFTITLGPEQVVDGELIFMPTEVAAYDFVMPILINKAGAPSPNSTPFPPSPMPVVKHTLPGSSKNSDKLLTTIITPSRHVIATALRQPLRLSHNRLEFNLPGIWHDRMKDGVMEHSQNTTFINQSGNPVDWALDLSKPSEVLEKGLFKFVHPTGVPFVTPDGETNLSVSGTLQPGDEQSIHIVFCPDKPGHYECLVPVILNGDAAKPYQYIHISGEFHSPRLTFDPLAIVMTPVPLSTEVAADFVILASQYRTSGMLEVELPEIECEDGSLISPLKVEFPDGGEIQPCCGDESQVEPQTIHVTVIFCSTQPVSFCKPIKFIDFTGQSFELQVTATSDNCLLTCYPFLALHRTDHHIVCEQGGSAKNGKSLSKESISGGGEVVFVPCASPNHNSRPSTSATSSNFQISSSSYETSGSDSAGSTPFARDGAMNKPPAGSQSQRTSRNQQDMASRSLGSAVFPDEDSEEGIFHLEVLLAVQRWFSSHGWPLGPNPLIIPTHLRAGLSKKPQGSHCSNQVVSMGGGSSSKRECRTVYDMVSHLSGRPVPGIPINTPLPSDPLEQVKQVYWQHATLLTFLRFQGACVASVKPEYLMQPQEYRLWKALQHEIGMADTILHKPSAEPPSSAPVTQSQIIDTDALETELFEAVSKRSWTDVLLQLFKCLMLSKITPQSFQSLAWPSDAAPLPAVNIDPRSSNIYGVGERVMLTWLNHCYDQFRKTLWSGTEKGGFPASRWVVNFDFDLLDGLVIGAALGAYMPFLIESHLSKMYTHPSTAEQCLHNALKIVSAMRSAGLDYDIQAIDITDPNPVTMLLFCTYLYQHLPQYMPCDAIEFNAPLNGSIIRQVRLSNPSNKPLQYQILLVGAGSGQFSLPKGQQVIVPAKSSHQLSVEFHAHFLSPCEAVLVLTGCHQGSSDGSTLVFVLNSTTTSAPAKAILKLESPCYELEKINLEVTNPYSEAGDFRVILLDPNSLDKSSVLSSNHVEKKKKKKRKKIRARVDHGQARADTPETLTCDDVADEVTYISTISTNKTNIPKPSPFYCAVEIVHLEANGNASIPLHFLPFQMGEFQSQVVLSNSKIGEFVYELQAHSGQPLPVILPYKPSPHSARISSAAAAGHGGGVYGGDDRVVYWRCEVDQTLNESLLVMCTNQARDKALLTAATQFMSGAELHRRRLTGTLYTDTVHRRMLDKFTGTSTEGIGKLQLHRKKSSVERSRNTEVTFTVQLDSDFFSCSDSMIIPNVDGLSTDTTTDLESINKTKSAMIKLPVRFRASEAGHYCCRILLQSPDDTRVFQVECSVHPKGSSAQLEFSTPLHQPVVQNIPLTNSTAEDWTLKASVEGVGFCGPHVLMVKAYQTSQYQLMFNPPYQAELQGKLSLLNSDNGTDHVYYLQGTGEKPLALDQIKLNCQAKDKLSYTLTVPNRTPKHLTYWVECDLPFVSGQNSVRLLPGKVESYTLHLLPSHRGNFSGHIAFVAGPRLGNDIDSDGDEIIPPDQESSEYYGYTVWYSLDVMVSPPPPERSLSITSVCHKKAVLDVQLKNPTLQELALTVQIVGRDLSGMETVTLPADGRDVYQLQYFPSAIGNFKGSLIFYNNAVGEFWYDLSLKAETPPPTSLPPFQCQLGCWCSQEISLVNPTGELLQLVPTVSNINNFALERDDERSLMLRPYDQLMVPIRFMPSTLGTKDHMATVTFHCEQLGEWAFIVSGIGTLPEPSIPVAVSATVGASNTLLIPWRNPTDHTVIVSVKVADDQMTSSDVLGLDWQDEYETPFCLLLRISPGVRVGPKSSLDIPVSFAPTYMHMYKAVCSLLVRREDGHPWEIEGTTTSDHASKPLSELCWLFPIHGVPESKIAKDSAPYIIECPARQRLEERLEITLTSIVPCIGTADPKQLRSSRMRSSSPERQPSGVLITQGTAMTEEFSYELRYSSDDDARMMSNAIALRLIEQHRDSQSGAVTLVFNVIYTPATMMECSVDLCVEPATGGVWKYPLVFHAHEPVSDDNLIIEATGLGKQSTTIIKLNSHTRYPEGFSAHFIAGSDPEFSVTPQYGELLPDGNPLTEIAVHFCPKVYGKIYGGKFVVQTPSMEWSYTVRGVIPDYLVPAGHTFVPTPLSIAKTGQQLKTRNYIRDNLRLITTAVSSPIKGAPVVHRTKSY